MGEKRLKSVNLEQAQRMRRPNGVIMVPWDMFDALVDAATEVERLKSMIRHCDHCGGSWVDDGIQVGCHCKEIKRLREALAEIERLPGNTYCGDIARRALGGSE